ncbi:MAG: hypothetical protein IJW13_00830 [Clostridia bacterium]|nr:hypothetical protein [Clostridia bacterium]
MAITLSQNKFYTIAKLEGGQISVNSSNGSQVISQEIQSGKKGEAVAVADEQITLYNGKILKRIRDNLIIE